MRHLCENGRKVTALKSSPRCGGCLETDTNWLPVNGRDGENKWKVRISVIWEGLRMEPLLHGMERCKTRWLGCLVGYLLHVFLVMCSGHVQQGEGPADSSEDAGESMSSGCLGTSWVPLEELDEVAGEREFWDFLFLTCCSFDPKPEKWKKMNVWMADEREGWYFFH